jgi:radical SAM family protein
MKVGIIELVVDTASKGWRDVAYGAFFKKFHASITPQAVSVWCRQLGHQVWYATYYGQRDPVSLLPDELDVVFVASYTQASALAYALAKVYRMRKTLTVIGGPHAKSFPKDCLRFFDLVVKDCDKTLVDDILRGHFDRRTVITSGRPLREIPSAEERMPEITAGSLVRGRRRGMSVVPLLSSIGCPYSCDFCVDWNNPYVLLPPELLEADLRYLSNNWPGLKVAYHDPNFGVKFDQVLGIIEKIPRERRSPYIIESSLSILNGPKLRRLKETNCIYIAPGVESWNNYSNKAGVGARVGKAKLTQVVEHFRELRRYVPGLQANFLFGTDADHGEEPAELTKEFMWAVPFVWPTVNIPTPFGNTPLYDRALANGQILESIPFSFYYTPYLVTTMPHYHPVEYYDKLIDIYSTMTSTAMLARRFVTSTLGFGMLHLLRTLAMGQDLAVLRLLRKMLATDSDFRAFHEGCPRSLPEFYHRCYEQKLGRYADLMPRAERIPELEKPALAPRLTAPVAK